MMALSSAIRAKVIACLELASRSDKAGKRDAALLGARRLLQPAGVGWADVVCTNVSKEAPPSTPPLGWRADLALCRQHPNLLTDWERRFTASLTRRTTITPRQRETLVAIVAKVRDLGGSV